MKKTIFAALAALLIIFAVTCGNFTPDEAETPQYTEDGRLLVPLTIGTANASRALTLDLAKGGVDYYEVAFQDPATPAKIYRTSWDKSKTGRIAVPAGNYDTSAKAILFAGRNSDKTLLAIGVLTGVDGVSSTTTIGVNSTSVTFTLSPLLNDIKAHKTESTFLITGPTSPDYATSTSITGAFPTATIDSITYPLFKVPANTASGITATYTVTCGADSAATVGVDPAIYANYAGVKINGTGRIISTGANLFGKDALGKDVGVEIGGTIAPAGYTVTPLFAAGGVAPTGIFDITLDTDGIEAGLTQITIDVPVSAINTTDAIIWHIQGGLTQNILDAGVAANSHGGAVLIAVGAVNITGLTIEIEP